MVGVAEKFFLLNFRELGCQTYLNGFNGSQAISSGLSNRVERQSYRYQNHHPAGLRPGCLIVCVVRLENFIATTDIIRSLLSRRLAPRPANRICSSRIFGRKALGAPILENCARP